jgi:hypothetical protein
VPAASDGKGSLELGTPANPAVSAETLGLHCRHPAGAGAWWPLSIRPATRLSVVSGPWPGDASGRADRSSCSCAPGSRVCDGGDDGLAGTYVS